MLSEPQEAAPEPILEGQAWDRFDALGRPSPNDRNLRIPAEDGVGRKTIRRLYGKSAAVRV